MEPTKELIEQLWLEEIEDARRLSIAQKLALSGDLFDGACRVTLAGIRNDHPGISDEDALIELHRRLDLGRRMASRL